MYDKHTLSNIENAFDYEEYVELNYSVKRTSGAELRVCCPMCGDSKYKCYVNNDKKKFNCFKCDFNSGTFDVFDFVAATESLTRGRVIMRLVLAHEPITPMNSENLLKSRLEGSESSYRAVSEIKTIDGLPKGCSPLRELPSGSLGWKYLLERGLTKEEILAANTHFNQLIRCPVYNSKSKYVGDVGRRVIFPVYGGDGKLVSWIARTTGIAKPKYINCPESEQSKTLWPYVRPLSSTVVLCEGILDSLALRRVPKTSSYATFGKSISNEQIALLKKWGVKKLLVFWDVDAKRDIIKASNRLKMHFEVFVPNWSLDSDPGDMLSNIDGIRVLSDSLDKPIFVDSLDFARWQVQ